MLNQELSPLDIFNMSPVIPVIVINKVEHAVPLAKALLAGGIKILEITLRSDAALGSIRRISDEVPEVIVGAGTVLAPEKIKTVAEAGGRFAITPGLTPALLTAAKYATIPLIPGVSTASEVMSALERGFTELKFFPAEAAGGVQKLKSLGGPFPQITFCPTGGISAKNYRKYLELANVACVGGSWIVPPDVIDQENWDKITELAQQALR
ncbi:MAG: keto-hydroxyglutarate-aldolase/keto-deoxy-phosphogluconate aldolase [Candidatus Electrothrix sp. AR3]|nr:keto-hydroxyglutarate-aldolase/keto-deoxy-phosphogluconate aldolase [Candidatus Electrothrix sp. AR3]